jgi:hypothetical protein
MDDSAVRLYGETFHYDCAFYRRRDDGPEPR